MVREAIAKAGFRFERTFTAFGVANFLGILTILWGAATAYTDLRASDRAQDVKVATLEKELILRERDLSARIGAIEARRARLDADHDAILEIRGDIKTIISRLDKRSSLEFFRLIDPQPFGAPALNMGRGRQFGAAPDAARTTASQ